MLPMCSKDTWQQGNMLLMIPLMEKKEYECSLYSVILALKKKTWLFEYLNVHIPIFKG